MHLTVSNTWTTAHDVEPILARTLDLELRYCLQPDNVTLMTRNGSSWDGVVRFWHFRKMPQPHYRFLTGLLPRVLRHCRRFQCAVKVEDTRIRPDFGTPLTAEIPLFDYQREAVEAVLKAGRGVVDSPPRSGKTRLMCEAVRRIALPTLWLAPTDRIVKQTIATLEDFFPKEMVVRVLGKNAEQRAMRIPLAVCTAAKSQTLSETFLATRQVIVVDEWHHAAAKTYTQLFRQLDHIYYRLGMTGTFFRSGDDTLSMHSLLSNTIWAITPQELLKQERLVPLDTIFLRTNHFDRVPTGGPHFLADFGRTGAFEHLGRNQMVALVAAHLARCEYRVLILVRTIAQGETLKKLLLPLLKRVKFTQFDPVEFISGQQHRKRTDAVFAAYNESDEIRVLIGTSIVGEGCDLPRADALVYAAAGAAEVSLLQNAYRVCTSVPGKRPRALLVDFTDKHQVKLHAQAKDRLRVYARQPLFTPHVMSVAHFLSHVEAAA